MLSPLLFQSLKGSLLLNTFPTEMAEYLELENAMEQSDAYSIQTSFLCGCTKAPWSKQPNTLGSNPNSLTKGKDHRKQHMNKPLNKPPDLPQDPRIAASVMCTLSHITDHSWTYTVLFLFFFTSAQIICTPRRLLEGLNNLNLGFTSSVLCLHIGGAPACSSSCTKLKHLKHVFLSLL